MVGRRSFPFWDGMTLPRCSMNVIFTYIYHTFEPINIGNYSIHGVWARCISSPGRLLPPTPLGAVIRRGRDAAPHEGWWLNRVLYTSQCLWHKWFHKKNVVVIALIFFGGSIKCCYRVTSSSRHRSASAASLPTFTTPFGNPYSS